MMRRLLVACLLAAPIALHAQGTLAGQGLGYPPGMLSTRALSLGGGNAEVDAGSTTNPAALGLMGRGGLSLQFAPEWRNTSTATASVKTKVARFPMFIASARVNSKIAVAGSFSTLTDRTWQISQIDTQDVGGTRYPSQLSITSLGALSEARAAVSYQLSERLYLGAAIIALTGNDRLTAARIFPDSAAVARITEERVWTGTGEGAQIGAVARPDSSIEIGVSYAIGGRMEARLGDTLVANAKSPGRMAATVTWSGLPGATLSARIEQRDWSKLRGLGYGRPIDARDTRDIGLGAELQGPKSGASALAIRLGFRSRDLPFRVNGLDVSETSFSGGLGLPFSFGRSSADVGVIRAVRTAGSSREQAWTLSVGFTVRP
ncbi:MAG: hypothetical protein K2X99_02065 [Gemmatimonadaceae bacterium]|nr:hypothetical protein [Gemmatimonadaceae bacterium]